MNKIKKNIVESLQYFGPMGIDEIVQKLEYREIRCSNTALTILLKQLVSEETIRYDHRIKIFAKNREAAHELVQ